QEGLRSRGTDAMGELANSLLENPLLNQALGTALGMGEKAAQAQKRAMDAVGLPSADELGRLERRIRSLSDRLEAVEDQLDHVARDVGALRRQLAGAEERPAAAISKACAPRRDHSSAGRPSSSPSRSVLATLTVRIPAALAASARAAPSSGSGVSLSSSLSSRLTPSAPIASPTSTTSPSRS